MESSGSLILNGGDGTDTLNVDDTGDTNANTGTLDADDDHRPRHDAGSITYDSFATLNVGLGTGGDTFTIDDTHDGTTNVNGNNGDDTINVKAISGPTTVERRQRPRHVQRRATRRHCSEHGRN